MTIVSSVHTVEHAQADGRSYVRETHTDSQGVIYVVQYLAAVGADYAAVRAARAVRLGEALAEEEATAVMGGS